MRLRGAARIATTAGVIVALGLSTVACQSADQKAVAGGRPLAMFQDDVSLLAHPAGTLQTLRSIGVGVVRVSVAWNAIAPSPTSRALPRRFNPGDPAAYPVSKWAPYDAVVRFARADGIGVDLLLTGPAPLWATGPHAPPSERGSGVWKPAADAYGKFVQAITARYTGSYVPRGASKPLPRVSFWELWNEPNWGPSLQPQMALHPVRVVSAPEYRRLVDAGWSSLRHTGHGHDTIVIGSLSPRGLSAPPDSALSAAIDVSSPLGFTRTLYCVDSSYRPLSGAAARSAGCPQSQAASRQFRQAQPALFAASGYGIHPYPVDLPPTQSDSTNPDTVEFSQIPKLMNALDHIETAYRSSRRIRVYNTEYGYITHPPNAGTEYLSPATAAQYLNWAEYLTWRDPRIATTMQYLLDDPSPGPSVYGKGGFATGLLFNDGAPKATFYAYRMPIFVPAADGGGGGALEVWGCVRPARYATLDTGRSQYVQIQFSASNEHPFRTIKTVRITDIRGYFAVRVAFPSSGTVRLRWSYPQGDPQLRDPLSADSTIYSREVRITLS